MSNIGALAVFAQVVESGGFSAAARVLGLSKSAVSKQVSALEDRLGARLLNRTTRRLALTEAGAAFFERARRILADLDEAERAVTALHAEPRGTLRVNAPMSFGILHLARALPEFMDRHPDLAIDLIMNDRVVDVIEEGFDVAVRIAKLPDSTLVARRIAPCRRVVCASPGYWARHGVPAHPRDLGNHNCLIYAYLLTENEWRFRGPDGPVGVHVSGSLRANNGEALCAAAMAGKGVLFTPTFIVGDHLRDGSLVPALQDWEESDLAIYAVYPHSRHLSAKVRAFVDYLARRFGGEPYWDAA